MWGSGWLRGPPSEMVGFLWGLKSGRRLHEASARVRLALSKWSDESRNVLRRGHPLEHNTSLRADAAWAYCALADYVKSRTAYLDHLPYLLVRPVAASCCLQGEPESHMCLLGCSWESPSGSGQASWEWKRKANLHTRRCSACAHCRYWLSLTNRCT